MRGGGVVNRKVTCFNVTNLDCTLSSNPAPRSVLHCFFHSSVQNVGLTLMVTDMALKSHVRVEVVPFLILFLACIY